MHKAQRRLCRVHCQAVCVDFMFWLMIALLVSLGALLVAAAGVARHIWIRRYRLHSNPRAGAGTVAHPAARAALDPIEEIDPEL
jgi:membrane-associated PAP2 superfamily phosphatase